jgi:hypothetical protein
MRAALALVLAASAAAEVLTYRQFAQRKPWARFGLVFAGVANGVAVGGWPMILIIVSALTIGLARDARMYALQRGAPTPLD